VLEQRAQVRTTKQDKKRTKLKAKRKGNDEYKYMHGNKAREIKLIKWHLLS
jgi:hypothetical protein